MTNQKNLIIIAIALMVLSILSYNRSVSRAERFERGQKFLSQLNADNIKKIEVTKGEEMVVLERGEDQFLVASKHGYPAKNETINRFINDSLNITLEKNVGDSESLAQELEVVDGGEKTTRVVFFNDAGKEMVRFMIGKASDDGRGNYVQRIDGDDQGIYLTSKGVYLASSGDSFLKKELLDVAETEVARIQGSDYVIEDSGDGLKLANLPKGKKESSEMSQAKGLLKALSFDKVYLSDETEVKGLSFNKRLSVVLKDDTSYQVSMAKAEDKHYFKISGFFDMKKLEGLTVGANETEEELKVKSDLLTRNDQITEFNDFHGPWIYELSEYAAKKFLFTRADLLEDEAKDEG